MAAEVLVVRDCPNEAPAVELFRTALAEVGLTMTITTTVVTDDATAEARGFTGSPTFLLDGRDLFPQAGAPVGIACRVYTTPTGLAGTPSLQQLCAALRPQTIA